MQGAVAFAGLSLLIAATAPTRAASHAASAVTPVTKVVGLLQRLSEKLSNDAKAEKDLYETFVCWCDTVKNSKMASNSAAESRIEMLTAYIADIEAGKIEFTTEKADLEIQEKNIMESLEKAKALRESEKKDFEAAEAEMEMAIKALEKAIAVLKEGTSLAQVSNSKLLDLRWNLRRVVELGKRSLSTSDQDLLQRMLDSDVPRADWKKLNRKATFKMKYNARSTRILEVLEKMLKSFEENLVEARAKETEAEAVYSKLTAANEKMLEKTQQALLDMVKEGAARGMSLQDAKDEVSDLEAQVEADKKFIEQTDQTCQEKEKEFTARRTLRQEELAAIGKAISVLNSDDAKDTFKASYGSLLLQLPGDSAIRRRTASVMVAAAAAAHDPRLLALAAVSVTGWKEKVIEQIDKLLATLKKEAEEDLHKKEECEGTLNDLARDATLKSREIDETTDTITKKRKEAAELLLQIEEQEGVLAGANKTLVALRRQREDEHLEFQKSVKDDSEAIELLESAVLIIKEFYEKQQLIQVRARMEPVAAGQAPPPPPATWEDPNYAVASNEGTGIQALLEMLVEDVKKDIAAAEAAEQEAVAAFEEESGKLEQAMKDAEKTIADLKGEKSSVDEEANEAVEIRLTQKKALDSVMKEITVLRPGCNFVAVNFNKRTAARNAEIDGLVKAKGILTGSDFGSE